MGVQYFHIRGYLFSNKIRGVAYFVSYFNNDSKNIKITKNQSPKKALATKKFVSRNQILVI